MNADFQKDIQIGIAKAALQLIQIMYERACEDGRRDKEFKNIAQDMAAMAIRAQVDMGNTPSIEAGITELATMLNEVDRLRFVLNKFKEQVETAANKVRIST